MNSYADYFQTVTREAGYKRFENQLLEQIKSAGLGEPEREYTFHTQRRWRFDFAYVNKKIAVEVEGGTWAKGRHNRGGGFEADCEKYNEAALDGWRVIRVTPKMVIDMRALGFIRRALSV